MSIRLISWDDILGEEGHWIKEVEEWNDFAFQES
jgi:hypothetical protein